MKKLKTDRIDVSSFTIKPMSHNISGHEKRMKALEQKVHREYFACKNCNCGICVPSIT